MGAAMVAREGKETGDFAISAFAWWVGACVVSPPWGGGGTVDITERQSLSFNYYILVFILQPSSQHYSIDGVVQAGTSTAHGARLEESTFSSDQHTVPRPDLTWVRPAQMTCGYLASCLRLSRWLR